MSDPGVEAAERSGPGPLLRRAREARGLSEQEAAEQLNLDSTIVQALESDDLAALGAPVFARGHLRRYGQLLGVPDEDLLTSYKQARTRPDQPTLVPHSRLEMTPDRGRPVWPWAIGGTLLFLLAAGLVAYVSEYGITLPGRAATPTETESVIPWDAGAPTAADERADGADGFEGGPGGPPSVAAATGGAVAAGTSTTDTAAASVGSAASSTAPAGAPQVPPVPPGQVSVTVTFATDSWAEIYDGAGKSVMYDLGRAGTQRTISAAAPISVTLGNAPGVSITVNGRPAAIPPRPAGQSVARFKIAADGSLH